MQTTVQLKYCGLFNEIPEKLRTKNLTFFEKHCIENKNRDFDDPYRLHCTWAQHISSPFLIIVNCVSNCYFLGKCFSFFCTSVCKYFCFNWLIWLICFLLLSLPTALLIVHAVKSELNLINVKMIIQETKIKKRHFFVTILVLYDVGRGWL